MMGRVADHDGVAVYHGDARELLPDVLPDAPQIWLMDPPYSSGGFQEAGRAGGSIGKMGPSTKDDRIQRDTLSTRGYLNLMRDVLRHSHQAREIAVFTDWRMWTTTTDALEYAGFTIRSMIVWIKPSHGIGRPWRNAHELIAFGMRNAASRDRIAQEANWIQCNRSGNVHHPTEKPLELVRRLIANMDDGVVVDPFMGSGTTLRAAKDLGRQAIGIDIDRGFCDVAVQRLGQMNLAVEATR